MNFLQQLAILGWIITLPQPVWRDRLPAGPQSQPKAAEAFRIGWMYWAPAKPIPEMDWRVVLLGTVAEIHPERLESVNLTLQAGTIRVERILRGIPTRNHPVAPQFTTLKTEGLNGLKPGDKVVVFAIEYDGGYGIVEAAHSNCKIGIKVSSWNDALVTSIERITRDFSHRANILRERREAARWKQFSARRPPPAARN